MGQYKKRKDIRKKRESIHRNKPKADRQHSMSFIDDRTYVVHKKPPTASQMRDPKVLNQALRSGQPVEAEKKSGNYNAAAKPPHPVGAAAAKLDNETEDFHVPRVPTEIKHRISKLRAERKMTQAELAQRINVPPRVVQDYERGTAVPDGATLSRMARALGVPTLKR